MNLEDWINDNLEDLRKEFMEDNKEKFKSFCLDRAEQIQDEEDFEEELNPERD